MQTYEKLLNGFVGQSKDILGNKLVGIYLHGSAVMGFFNPDKSDIDLIAVVNESLTDEEKRNYLSMLVKANDEAPAKGIEMSIVKDGVCSPFVYPTPFELHFSAGCLDWYRSSPEDFVQKMNGEDKDLAAHFTVIRSRGKVLFGKPVNEVFGTVEKRYYFDSIWFDIEGAKEDIADNTMYIILNLTRVLAYAKDELILSKKEGGEWGLTNLPNEYSKLIASALGEYERNIIPDYDISLCKSYAEYMVDEIRKYKNV